MDDQKNENYQKNVDALDCLTCFLIIIGFAVSQVVETQTFRLAFKTLLQ